MIRLFDVSVPPKLQEELERVAVAVLRSGEFGLGARVERFEASFAAAVGAPHAVGLNSGTDALVLGLRALGIGPGDEVIVPALSFYASAEAVLQAGAKPVLADVDETLTLSPSAAEAALTPKTAALMPVHLYGHPADMPALLALAARHGLAVIEDAAQAVGAAVAGRMAGSWGDAGCFSFYPTKNLGAAGDAGMLVTGDGALAQRVRALRVHGATKPYYHEEVGYTSRLDALQAAVLQAKLPHLAAWTADRREHAAAYDEAFGAHLSVRTPAAHEGHVYHLYNLRLPRRDEVMRRLGARGVETRAYYPHALPDLPPLKGMAHGDAYEARRAAGELLSLPVHPRLSAAGREAVIAAVLSVLDALWPG
ncbi:MAG: DegT/DnrJ/EryC1/StrS family aminotransferase [Deinococcota bacterium]|nr:DegT/DnrJ/EryC1/StrS family aminotransferase [Deinococcota bacterium]